MPPRPKAPPYPRTYAAMHPYPTIMRPLTTKLLLSSPEKPNTHWVRLLQPMQMESTSLQLAMRSARMQARGAEMPTPKVIPSCSRDCASPLFPPDPVPPSPQSPAPPAPSAPRAHFSAARTIPGISSSTSWSVHTGGISTHTRTCSPSARACITAATTARTCAAANWGCSMAVWLPGMWGLLCSLLDPRSAATASASASACASASAGRRSEYVAGSLGCVGS
mmetsp:Transcript_3239/g.7487  ORF Transcript_3239/g.7487 Transcript_3239/m.7487 type:complete len:222 (+) Transcript_3239:463-1128(+)